MQVELYIRDAFGKYQIANNELIHAVSRYRLNQRFAARPIIASSSDTKDFLISQLALEEREQFCVIWLDTRHRVLEFNHLFYGTIDGASIWPREVVKQALGLNAAACIFAHNHPSGIPEPSVADRTITQRLVEALKLVEIRVLDHLVIGGGDAVSFAERGLL